MEHKDYIEYKGGQYFLIATAGPIALYEQTVYGGSCNASRSYLINGMNMKNNDGYYLTYNRPNIKKMKELQFVFPEGTPNRWKKVNNE